MIIEEPLREKLLATGDSLRWERFPPLGNPDDPDVRDFENGKELVEWMEQRRFPNDPTA
jgi:hypothetical protein